MFFISAIILLELHVEGLICSLHRGFFISTALMIELSFKNFKFEKKMYYINILNEFLKVSLALSIGMVVETLRIRRKTDEIRQNIIFPTQTTKKRRPAGIAVDYV